MSSFEYRLLILILANTFSFEKSNQEIQQELDYADDNYYRYTEQDSSRVF